MNVGKLKINSWLLMGTIIMGYESVILTGNLITPHGVLGKSYLGIKGGVVVEVGEGRPTKLPSSNVLNYRDFTVMPGFIDTHIHGYGGVDSNTGDAGHFLRTSKGLVKHGVTAFLPSTVTAPHEELLSACRAVRDAVSVWEEGRARREVPGARILGIHLEGPYVNPAKKGAQNPAYIREASTKEILNYLDVAGNLLKMVTLAPEVRGALEATSLLVSRGVVVSVGHTNATYEEALKAFAAGASRATHLFNAMRPIHHRDPGVVIAALESTDVFIELIADFIHLHPATVKFAINHAGTWRTVLISDAISAAGLPDGEYSLGGLKVIVKGGVARLESGALAGSTLTLDKAVRNVTSLGYTLPEVTRMASFNPARNLRLAGLGDVRPGYRADLVVLDDDLRVVATIVDGEVVHER